jgi:hypothetical protein
LYELLGVHDWQVLLHSFRFEVGADAHIPAIVVRLVESVTVMILFAVSMQQIKLKNSTHLIYILLWEVNSYDV